MTNFRIHGQFKIRLEGQYLISEVVGPWNRELVDLWSREAFLLIKQFTAAQPYVGICTIYESMLCPPDALELLSRVARFSTEKQHCLGNGIVANASVDGRNLVEALYKRIGLYDFFDDFAAAKKWADTKLAEHARTSGQPLS